MLRPQHWWLQAANMKSHLFGVLPHVTFILGEVQLENRLHQRICVDGQGIFWADLWLQRTFYPLFLRDQDTLYQRIWDLEEKWLLSNVMSYIHIYYKRVIL